jgi:hypothetical protein
MTTKTLSRRSCDTGQIPNEGLSNVKQVLPTTVTETSTTNHYNGTISFSRFDDFHTISNEQLNAEEELQRIMANAAVFSNHLYGLKTRKIEPLSG